MIWRAPHNQGGLVHRDQRINARANHSGLVILDQHLRHQRLVRQVLVMGLVEGRPHQVVHRGIDECQPGLGDDPRQHFPRSE
jgi:hypothetical protein